MNTSSTWSAARLFSVLGLLLLGPFGCSAALPAPQPPKLLAFREMADAAVVVVKVKPPWYALRPFIVKKFREAVPEYQAAPGLERKQFSLSARGEYGGIYLWSDRATAERWFDPAWHERIRKLRGVDGDVRFLRVTRGLDGPVAPSVFEGPMVVTIASGRLDGYAGAPGLRAAYEGEGLVVGTWDDRARAKAFLGAREDVEWFETPVGLVNKP